MLLLTGTTHLLRLTCGAAGADVRVHASWVDADAGVYASDSKNTPAITTTTPTTVVPSPTGTVDRNVKHLNITNNHATVATSVLVEHYDGTTYIPLMGVTLLPGESLTFTAMGEWRHHDSQGAEYSYTGNFTANLGPAGTLAETMPRQNCGEVNSAIPGASGTLWLQAIYLYAGQVINNITLSSATTAAVVPTNYAAGIYTLARSLVANTANQTTTAWAANTVKTLPLTAAYRVPSSGVYYIGFYMTATTVLTTKGGLAKTGGQLAAVAPILGGTSTTGLTTALPATAAAISSSLASLYAAVS